MQSTYTILFHTQIVLIEMYSKTICFDYFQMAALNVPNLDENLDSIFDHFIQTLCSTHMAVSIDTDAQRKFQFKLYLVTGLVPFTTLSRNLGCKQDDPDLNVRTTEEICHKF